MSIPRVVMYKAEPAMCANVWEDDCLLSYCKHTRCVPYIIQQPISIVNTITILCYHYCVYCIYWSGIYCSCVYCIYWAVIYYYCVYCIYWSVIYYYCVYQIYWLITFIYCSHVANHRPTSSSLWRHQTTTSSLSWCAS